MMDRKSRSGSSRPGSSAPAVWLALALGALGCDGEAKQPPGQWPIARDQLAQQAAPKDEAELNYRRYCIGCHGSDGRGNGGLTGADLSAPDGPMARRTEAELAASVRDGKRGRTASMPAHKPVLDDAQILALIGYLRTHFGQAAEPAAQAREPLRSP